MITNMTSENLLEEWLKENRSLLNYTVSRYAFVKFPTGGADQEEMKSLALQACWEVCSRHPDKVYAKGYMAKAIWQKLTACYLRPKLTKKAKAHRESHSLWSTASESWKQIVCDSLSPKVELLSSDAKEVLSLVFETKKRNWDFFRGALLKRGWKSSRISDVFVEIQEALHEGIPLPNPGS